VIPKLVQHFARRAPSISLGNLQVEREFNDVQMVCSAYLQLLQHGEPGQTYNVCSGQPYALQVVIDELTRITGHPIQVAVNPAFVRANEVHRLCGSPAKLQARLAAHGVKLQHPPLQDTLRRMLNAVAAAPV
jgi:nucleoside-diphosphate-sugar epimerase